MEIDEGADVDERTGWYKKALPVPEDIATEKDASKVIRQLALNVGWGCEEQYKLPNGTKIDFLMTAPLNRLVGGTSFQFGIECKPCLSLEHKRGLNVTNLAAHFEQCVGYARELNLPVFLGPYLTSGAYTPSGGTTVRSMDAFNLFGGRVNVGTLAYSEYNLRRSIQVDEEASFWALVLRGKRMWRSSGYKSGYHTDVATLVTSQGSKKERESILTTL